jgi:hypothetical protein
MSTRRELMADLRCHWGDVYVRHEAPFNRAEVSGLRRCGMREGIRASRPVQRRDFTADCTPVSPCPETGRR